MRPEFYDCCLAYPGLGFDQEERIFISKLLTSVFVVQHRLNGLWAGDLSFPEFDHPFLELDLLEARAFRLTRKLYRLIRELEELELEEPYY